MIHSGVIYYPASILGQAHSKSNSPYSLFKSNEHSTFILRQDMKILCKTASQDILPCHIICLHNFAKVHRRRQSSMLKSMLEGLNKPAGWKSYNVFLRTIIKLSSCRLVKGKNVQLTSLICFCFVFPKENGAKGHKMDNSGCELLLWQLSVFSSYPTVVSHQTHHRILILSFSKLFQHIYILFFKSIKRN